MQVNGIIETHRRNKHNLYLHGITNNTNHVVFPSPGILMYAPALGLVLQRYTVSIQAVTRKMVNYA